MPEEDPAVAHAGDERASAPPPRRPQRDGGLRVVVSDESGRAAAPGLAAWLRRAAPRRARGPVSAGLVSDQRIRALNRTYRRTDSATDVLSFPAFARDTRARVSARRARPSRRPPGLSRFLGDIVIARGVARRQAREAGHSERTELKVLALHGLLHLLGYDHERDAGRMRRMEQRLRRQGGLREGLIERAR